jgi:hypothetical protein
LHAVVATSAAARIRARLVDEGILFLLVLLLGTNLMG